MDNLTLLIIVVTLSGLSSFALVVTWIANRQIPGLAFFPIGFGAIFIGSAILPVAQAFPNFFSTVIAFTLIVAGSIPLSMGLSLLWHQERSPYVLLAGGITVATFLGLLAFTFVVDSPFIRLKIFSSALIGTAICNVLILLKGMAIEKSLRPYSSGRTLNGLIFTIILSALYAVLNSGIMFLTPEQATNYASTLLSIILMGMIILVVLFPFSVVIMATEDLRMELQDNAIYDPVTHLINSRAFIEMGHRIVGVAIRYDKPVSLLTIELAKLDEFTSQMGEKQINLILKEFAAIATKNRRNEDVLSRFGRKEFRMLLPGVDDAAAQRVREKIFETFQTNKLRIPISDAVYEIEPVIVVTTLSGTALSLQNILNQGDLELIKAKTPVAAI